MLSISASMSFVTNCPECCAEVEKTVYGALRDGQVARLNLTASHRHCHFVEPQKGKDKGLAPPPSAAALEAAGQQTLPGTLDGSKAYAGGE